MIFSKACCSNPSEVLGGRVFNRMLRLSPSEAS